MILRIFFQILKVISRQYRTIEYQLFVPTNDIVFTASEILKFVSVMGGILRVLGVISVTQVDTGCLTCENSLNNRGSLRFIPCDSSQPQRRSLAFNFRPYTFQKLHVNTHNMTMYNKRRNVTYMDLYNELTLK